MGTKSGLRTLPAFGTDKQGAGLDAQRAEIEAEAARRGWPEPRWIVDNGFSGGNVKRPGLTAALAALGAGRAQAMIVTRPYANWPL